MGGNKVNFSQRKRLLLGISLVSLSILCLFRVQTLIAQDCEQISCPQDKEDLGYITCIKDKQVCWEAKIDEAQSAQTTLANTISILNGQIQVQELNIQQTQAEIQALEKEIDNLNQRIGGLDLSLDQMTRLMVKRVGAQYKRSYVNPVSLMFNNDSLSGYLSDYKYLKLARQQTVEAMQRAETQRLAYDEQKTLKEQKQAQVEAKRRQLEQQQTQLEKQRGEQQYLLKETKNNEARYQNELAKTLEELQAIQSIIAGRGSEQSVGDIKEGDQIATIIAGPSACSTGGHLHFEVVKDSAHRDPAGYLKSIDATWDNSPDTSFGLGGSWEWPMYNSARITQGYGMTYYARVRRAYGGSPHTGIDMVSKTTSDYRVRAVKNGKLYRGSIPCGGGLLRYVKVEHHDDGLSTYYLHINY